MPLVTPTQDMIIGAFYLTEQVKGAKGEGRVFRALDEVERAYEGGDIELHALITYRRPEHVIGEEDGRPVYRQTTAGRVFFNTTLPESFEFQNVRLIDKKVMGRIVDELAHEYDKADVAASLDRIKDLCYRFAARSGLTISIEDVKTPVAKKEILDRHEKEADKVETQFRRGIITDGERRSRRRSRSNTTASSPLDSSYCSSMRPATAPCSQRMKARSSARVRAAARIRIAAAACACISGLQMRGSTWRPTGRGCFRTKALRAPGLPPFAVAM